jgi:LacI family transcriptional regulator
MAKIGHFFECGRAGPFAWQRARRHCSRLFTSTRIAAFTANVCGAIAHQGETEARMHRVNIADVARLAGVSIKTVSRVINNEPNVTEATRARVREAIRQLDFRPSAAARTLAGQRSHMIALIHDNASAYYTSELQRGANERCTESAIRLLSHRCNRASSGLRGEVIDLCEEAHVDGVLLTPPISDNVDLIAAIRARGIAYALASPVRPEPGSCSATMPHCVAAEAMTEHLIALGHRRIGFVKGHPDHPSAGERFRGFGNAMRRAALPIDEELLAQGFYNFASGEQAGYQLMQRRDRPTAIFACNDDIAAGVIAAAHRLGLEIPNDMSIAGFDDTNLAEAVWPPLTTIRQHIFELGYVATDLLLAAVEGIAKPSVQLGFELIVRQSTSHLRADAQ